MGSKRLLKRLPNKLTYRTLTISANVRNALDLRMCARQAVGLMSVGA
jgi:hypothetical protein